MTPKSLDLHPYVKSPSWEYGVCRATDAGRCREAKLASLHHPHTSSKPPMRDPSPAKSFGNWTGGSDVQNRWATILPYCDSPIVLVRRGHIVSSTSNVKLFGNMFVSEEG